MATSGGRSRLAFGGLVCFGAVFIATAACRGAARGRSDDRLVIETWGADERASHPRGVKILDAGGASAVVRVDLSTLPKGAKIARARLWVRRDPVDGSDEAAMIPCEVFPLTSPYRAGVQPKPAGQPLAIAAPWYDHFDATEIVRRWTSRRASNFGLYVRSLPGWRRPSTRLEIAYHGRPRNVPAQVSGLKAFHRAGQTFVTWKEIEDPFGPPPVKWARLRKHLAEMDAKRVVRYRVYRHGRPIDATTIAQAELLAVVRPCSGFNVHSWSRERLINQVVFGDDDRGELGKYDPFAGWDRDSEQGGRLVIPRFVVDERAGPLAPGVGLYVHSARKAERAYYAVVASVNGTANTADFSPGNSLAQPLAESPGTGQPVRQTPAGGRFGFDFPGRKEYFVTWVAPPLSNLPSRYFNWCVHLPPKRAGRAPLNVSFHARGFSYAKPIRRFDRSAIQIAGHDVGPVSGWYGYHECLDTLRSWKEGKVQPYTERRLTAFIEWVKKKWPIDDRRCFADGRGMGGTGAVHFACKHPGLFAYVLCDRGAVTCRDSQDLPALESAWGRVAWALPAEQCANVWDWQDLTWFVRHKGRRWALPVLSFSPVGHTAWQDKYPRQVVSDRNARWTQSHRDYTRLFRVLGENRHMFFADFDWGPTLGILPEWMDVAAGPIPVVTHSSDRKIRPTADGPFIFWEPSGSSPSGWIHWHHRWRSDDAVDEPGRLEITLYVSGPNEVTADVTPRRAAAFRPKPGETLRWTNIALAEGGKNWALNKISKKYPKRGKIQQGTVTADADGLVTVKGVIILPTRCRLVLRREEARP